MNLGRWGLRGLGEGTNSICRGVLTGKGWEAPALLEGLRVDGVEASKEQGLPA